MKKTTFAGWFGTITPEEVEKVRDLTRDFEKRVMEYQNRPTDSDTEGEKKS